ncbi:MAG TPA: diphthine synthase [Candidatus Nanoarchaeia archaeon]|nr:diphthine synthase [Candidatus Nanoarchaeia archaeon]
MLYLIGIGLSDEKDITVKGLEAVKRCDAVYLENYTSKLTNASVSELEKFYGKKVILADRIMVENDVQKILDEAKRKDVSLLIIGDVFGATTHAMILLEAKKQGIKVEIIHNASILNVVGEVGLELYKFGHITSIPFENKNIQTPVEIFKKNYENNLHTLFLLDLDPKNGKFMTVNEAADYLIRNGVGNIRAVACGALGSKNSEIRAGNLKDLDIKGFPQCLIIPAKKLHFVEEEALDALAH